MGMVFGRKDQGIVINMREIIKMIKKMVMVFLLGRQEIFIKEIMKVIFDMD